MRIFPSCVVFCIALLAAGCARQSASLIPAQGSPDVPATRPHVSVETVLHAFTGGKDGANPQPVLVVANGTLFGADGAGGACNNCGAAYSIGTDGKGFTVIHAFAGGSDGAGAENGFLLAGNTLYGTTQFGGGTGCAAKYTTGCGTVFSIGTSGGAYKTLYRFAGGKNAAWPATALTALGGTMYGTGLEGAGTTSCGFTLPGCGSIYSINAAGKEQLAHAFTGGKDGKLPNSTPIVINGILYGTTIFGGGSGCGGNGCGTVYTYDPSKNVETVLLAFNANSGVFPQGDLLQYGSNLYGVVNAGVKGYGGVYVIDYATGTQRVIYAFKGGNDGANPTSGLTLVGNVFYGVTSYGGGSGCASKYYTGCGTVYKITPSGTESVVYSFKGGQDGYNPQNGLTAVNGKLYGTTYQGGGTGCGGSGCGTIFRLTP